MQEVIINGELYKIRFKHVANRGSYETYDIYNAEDIALKLGQIKKYCSKKQATPIKACTVCELSTTLDKKTMAIGFAFCGDNDQFSRRVGRSISFNRARKNLEKNKDLTPIKSFIYPK
jgi:hypothetical protein